MTMTQDTATTGPRQPLPDSVLSLARYAELFALAGMVLFGVYVCYTFVAVLYGAVDSALSEQFLDTGEGATFTPWQRGIGVVLDIAPHLLGMAALQGARLLFAGYRRGEVFTLVAASRLRFIGWMMVLMAPATVLARTLGVAFFTAWTEPGMTNITVEIDGVEVYAIVFGLLVVVIGHVMYRAIEIDAENRTII